MVNNIETIKLPSGLNISMSSKLYNEKFCNFDDNHLFLFQNFVNSGEYFPQVMQFFVIIVLILNGYISFIDIFLGNLLSGVVFSLIWYLLKLYKIPGISFIFCFIGGIFFRLFLHFIPIIIISAIIKHFEIIPICLFAGLITQIIKAFINARLSNIKYIDEVILYTSSL